MLLISLTTLAAVIYSIPLYVAIVNAFKQVEQILKSPLSLPAPLIINNFMRTINEIKILTLYANSVMITVSSLIGLVLLCSLMGYIFGRRSSIFSKILYGMVLSGLMVPVQAVLIPSMKTLKFYNLLGTFAGLIFFYSGTYMAIGTFLYTEFIRTVPRALDESAAIDGASQLHAFIRVILPLLKPVTATVLIFLGMWVWNDFLPPLYILGTARGKTVTIGIFRAIGLYTTDWTIVFPAVILASLPMVVLFLSLQREFKTGLTAGSIK